MAGEGLQQVVLGWSQVDLSAAHRDAPPLEIDLEIACAKHGLSPAWRSRGMPQRDPNASQELVDAERLCQVVVGDEVESSNLVAFRRASGEHDDWRAGVLSDAADQIVAVGIRQ